MKRSRFARELVEVHRRVAAQCREAELLDAANDHRRDRTRIEVTQIAGVAGAYDVALDNADECFVDLDALAREAATLHAIGTLSDRLKPG